MASMILFRSSPIEAGSSSCNPDMGRPLQESRGLGDVYKRQVCVCVRRARQGKITLTVDESFGKIPLTVDESFGIIESRLEDGAQYNVIWSLEQQS